MAKASPKYARRMTDTSLHCRTLTQHGAAFRLMDRPTRVRIKGRVYTELRWRCSSCGAVRIDVLDGNMNLHARRYKHVDGYRLTPEEIAAEGRPNVLVWRSELLRRHTPSALPPS